MSLNDEIALVTGASRGIGRAIAVGLGQAGAVVVGTATSTSGAEQISAYLQEQGIRGAGMRGIFPGGSRRREITVAAVGAVPASS